VLVTGLARWRQRARRRRAVKIAKAAAVLVAIGGPLWALAAGLWDDAARGPAPPATQVAALAPQSVPPEAPVAPAPPAGEGGGLADLVGSAALGEEARVAVVQALERDPSPAGIDALLAAAGDPSLVVSMAGIRALAGRACARVDGALMDLLDDPLWQRRAWAARVLGANGCDSARGALRAGLDVERDPRVRRQMAAAIAALPTP
jgi:HEAT repeat protein